MPWFAGTRFFARCSALFEGMPQGGDACGGQRVPIAVGTARRLGVSDRVRRAGGTRASAAVKRGGELAGVRRVREVDAESAAGQRAAGRSRRHRPASRRADRGSAATRATQIGTAVMVGADLAAIWAARFPAARALGPAAARHHGQLPEATAGPRRASVRQLVVARPGDAQVRTTVVGCRGQGPQRQRQADRRPPVVGNVPVPIIAAVSSSPSWTGPTSCPMHHAARSIRTLLPSSRSLANTAPGICSTRLVRDRKLLLSKATCGASPYLCSSESYDGRYHPGQNHHREVGVS